jgi:hypothetical protein
VRWRWQWVANARHAAGAFDFTGTLLPDNTIAGTVERREIGFSSNFTAKNQSIATAAARGGAPPGGAATAPYGTATRKFDPVKNRFLTPQELGFPETPSPPAGGIHYAAPQPYYAPIDPTLQARANSLFPFVSQQNERTRYIIDEMNAAADRQHGNSYSIRVIK